jgi:hypothetical protein
VISGTLGIYVEGCEDQLLGPGTYVYRPAGLFHATFNPTDEPGEHIEITSPGQSYQEWLLEVDEMMLSGDATQAMVHERAKRRGQTFAPDELTQALVDKYGLQRSSVFWNEPK